MRGTLTQRGHYAEWLNADCRTPPCAQTGCVPGFCSGANFSLSAPRELLEHFASTFRPDTIVVNSGFWGGFNAPQTLIDLAAAAVAMRAVGVRDLIWKVTTAWMSPKDHSKPGLSELEKLVFWDRLHFQQAVYRGLNEALLLDLMRGCDACAGLNAMSREPDEQG